MNNKIDMGNNNAKSNQTPLPSGGAVGRLQAVYFIGAGGIGMSAIARYFLKKGLVVAGYDRTPSDLTRHLEKEGVLMHYEENVDEIPFACKQPKTSLVIYPSGLPLAFQSFRKHG